MVYGIGQTHRMADERLEPVDNISEARGSAETNETFDFDCPRCGTPVSSLFYGPCDKCRDQLRAKISAEATDIEVGDYEPKMNVTPNAVALKD